MHSLATSVSEVPLPSFRVLGTRVNAIQIPDAIAWIERQIQTREATRYVAVTGMHGVMESNRDEEFRAVLDAADLVVPDGMPLVWVGRARGYNLQRRVYGPELMATFCRETGALYRHFFYGGAPGVPEHLAEVLQKRWGIHIAGTYSPPFRSLTDQDKAEVIARIQEAAPDILWVGLSTPKQERWMYEYRDKLDVPVMLGVGAAFDLNTGRLKQAPQWMRENGLEWLFRLLAEPRRLWRRYLICGSLFVWNVLLESTRIKRFD